MRLEEYEQGGRALYQKLAETVGMLLERVIISEPDCYRLQQVQHRAKTVESLSRRLEKCGQLETDEIEAHRKDLAGCRIVFYTDNDVTKFTKSGLLHELFDVDRNRSKIHHPQPDEKSVDKLFQSHNYVLKLKADRTDLLEYRELEGLFCEVQVQTSLNHAWAEMAHDTIYKKPELQGFGTQNLKTIEQMLEDAMCKHLRPVGYLFQRIATDVQRLAEGKDLFDADILDKVLAAKNNNDRYEALEWLEGDVLPYYDDIQGMFPEIRDKLKEAWLIAGKTETIPHEIPSGGFPGIEPHEVTAQIAEIIRQYRYLDPDENYVFIRDLYVQTPDAKSLDQLIKLAECLAGHTRHIWKKHGPYVQVRLAELLSDEKDITLIAPLALTIAGEILKPDIIGNTASSKGITFERGGIVYSKALEKARGVIVEIIASHAESVVGDDDALQSAVSLLFNSGETPQHGGESPEAATMILSDLARSVERINEFALKASLNARQDIEWSLLQCWRRKRSLPGRVASAANVIKAHARLLNSITTLQDTLNADEEFVAFKTMVGYKSVLPHHWGKENSGYNLDKKMRYQRQDELVDGITPENWPIWKSRLATAANVKSDDLATFPPYEMFLSKLAFQRPRFAFELLDDRSILPDWTIVPIAAALLNGEMREDVEALLGQWLDESHFFSELAYLVVFANNIGSALIRKIAVRSVNDADERACTRLVQGAIRRYSDDPQFWRDEIFFPCLSVLQQAGSHDWFAARDWLAVYVPQPGEGSLFSNLTKDQSRTVLESMVGVDSINYSAELILMSIAAMRHQMILDWFGQRIAIAVKEAPVGFEPVPFKFNSLHKELQSHPKEVIDSIRRWFDSCEGGRLLYISNFLSRVYPNFEEPLPGMLLDLVNSADTEYLKFISSSLKGFEGREDLLPILRAILASDAANDMIESNVSCVFGETGVMWGEYGVAGTFQAKADAINPWLNDNNKRVSKFAAREIKRLELQVASENRRVQEQIAARKLQYGEPLSEDRSEDDNDDGDDTGPK